MLGLVYRNKVNKTVIMCTLIHVYGKIIVQEVVSLTKL